MLFRSMLLLFGEHIVRVTAAVLSGGIGAILVFVMTRYFQPSLACAARLGISLTAGVILAILALCLLKTGLFVLGAVSFGALAHLLWDSFPLQDVSGPFTIATRAGWYYISIGGASIVGGIVAHKERKKLMRAASSAVGASGLAFVTFLAFDRSGDEVPAPILLVLLVGGTLLGLFVQTYLSKRKKRRRTLNDRDRGDVVRGIPMGVAV